MKGVANLLKENVEYIYVLNYSKGSKYHHSRYMKLRVFIGHVSHKEPENAKFYVICIMLPWFRFEVFWSSRAICL